MRTHCARRFLFGKHSRMLACVCVGKHISHHFQRNMRVVGLQFTRNCVWQTEATQYIHHAIFYIHIQRQTNIWHLSGACPEASSVKFPRLPRLPQTFGFARRERPRRFLTLCPLTVWLLAPIEQICAEGTSDLRPPCSDWLADAVKVTEELRLSWFTLKAAEVQIDDFVERIKNNCIRNQRCLNKARLKVCRFLIMEKMAFYRHKTNRRTHIKFSSYNRPDSVYKTIWPHVRQIPEVVRPYVPLSVFVLHNTTKTARLKPRVRPTRITQSKLGSTVKYGSEGATIKRRRVRMLMAWEENEVKAQCTAQVKKKKAGLELESIF